MDEIVVSSGKVEVKSIMSGTPVILTKGQKKPSFINPDSSLNYNKKLFLKQNPCSHLLPIKNFTYCSSL